MNKQVKIEYYDDEAEAEISMMVPAKNEMCEQCRGDGRVDNPAFSNGITQSDREEMGEESFQDYMNGCYDVTCPCCRGERVRKVADVSMMTYAQKRFAVKVRTHRREQAQYEREDAAMRRAEMGHGQGYFGGYY